MDYRDHRSGPESSGRQAAVRCPRRAEREEQHHGKWQRVGGVTVNPYLNIATPIGFEPLGGDRSVVVPDFGMFAHQVEPVMRLMRSKGWLIGCLYNQETDEHPQLYFSHQWKVGNAYELAKEVRAGLGAHRRSAAVLSGHTFPPATPFRRPTCRSASPGWLLALGQFVEVTLPCHASPGLLLSRCGYDSVMTQGDAPLLNGRATVGSARHGSASTL